MRKVEHGRSKRALHLFGWIVLYFLFYSTAVSAPNYNVTLNSLTNHNTSAYPTYNEANFSANFGDTTWVNQNGTTMPVDPTKYDESLNAVTPAHVSKMDVHKLIPSRPDLRWFAHATPWFGSSSHINIGLNYDTTNYVASMVTDMKNRGFNGVIIDWYGRGSYEDNVALLIQSYLDSIPANNFNFIIMIDVGVSGGTSLTNLQAQIQYIQSQYFTDPNYEHEPLTTGSPILMFFDVRNTIGQANMNTLKADTGGQMVWVEQGTSYLSEAWEDECFEWTDEYDTGVNTNDPFNLTGVTNNYPTIKSSGKKAFGAMCSHFDGTLTKSVSWSLGKYLPSSNGLCEVERAAAINTAIPANMTRMQWATWSDWEEGTEVEAGIENTFSLTTQISGPNLISWNIVSGDERTIDHYEVYVSTNGVTAALLGSVASGVHQLNFFNAGLPPASYQLYVDAIGKPCIRDHMSPPLSYVTLTTPVIESDVQPLFQNAWQQDTVSLSVTAAGAKPLSYQWLLNGQVIAGATNSAYSFPALAGTNEYQLVVSNSYGTANSSVATVAGVPGTFLNPANYNRMNITFAGYTNSETLLDFPVMVRLGSNIPGFSYSQFASPNNGADLRFAAADGRELPYQIDTWNPSGESYVWVQVPSISSTNYITACWGNPADETTQPWTTNGTMWTTLNDTNEFVLVYHLGQSGFPFADSTLKYPANSGVAPASTAGIVGNGNAFTGTQFMDAGLVNLSKTFTVSAWVNIASTANSEQTIWCNKSGGWNVDGWDFYVDSYNTNDGIIYFDTADGQGGEVPPRTAVDAVSFGQWHLLTGTLDGVNGAAHVYVDGLDETINTSVDTAFQVTNYVRCGSLLTGTPGTGGSLCLDGTMDETRIEDSVRDPAWVWASWATVADSGFSIYGAVEPPAPILYGQQVNGQLILTWMNGVLQSAPAVTGPYSDVSGATSAYTVVPTLSQQYFRLRQ